MSDSDNSGFKIEVGVMDDRIAVAFHAPIKWFSLPPALALALAKDLQTKAQALIDKEEPKN